MADSARGPIYSKPDVERIIDGVLRLIDAGSPPPGYILARVLERMDPGRPLTFRPDEPVYVLRASDERAEDMLTEFIGSLEEDGTAPSKDCMEMWDVRNAFMQWQAANPHRVGDQIVELGGPGGGHCWRVTSGHLANHPDALSAAVHARATGARECTYGEATVELVPDTEVGS